jgi:hypothetical protein
MKNTGQDNRFLAEAIPQLQDYLLSNEMYWPLSGSLPRLTPGSVLLILARISVLQPNEAQRLRGQFEAVRTKWESAWNKKVAREITNRLRLWSQFVSDYKNSPEQNADSYPNEARGRAILQLLLNELTDAPEKLVLGQLDSVISARLVPDVFLWEAELQTVFPAKEFWFLYGKL